MAKAGVNRRLSGGWVVAGLTLAGCAGGPARPAPSTTGPVSVQTRPLALPSPYGGALRDTCGKTALAWLVGRPETLIPITADLSHRRVACTACPPPSDVRLDRVNILYDAQTKIIVRLSCG